GNGPQVGDELARNEIAADQVEPLPLGVLVAGTAGWMGYMIQQSRQNALVRAGVERSVVTLITQTLCRADDPDLRTPSKPVGHALDAVRQSRLAARGIPVRDGRRLAPSPKPAGIVERDMVRDLARAGHIVIAGGGGGPPRRRRRRERGAGGRPGGAPGRSGNDDHEGARVNLHEYQARNILRMSGIPVPPGEVATTPAEARAIAERLGGKVVVKAQVHAGGRGKAGGVKLAKTAVEAET